MARRKRTPEENARREKIRELLQLANIGSMDDIQRLFKETIAEFMENGLDAELDDELGYSRYDYKNKNTDNSLNGHSSKTLRTSFGDVEVSVPRDRQGEFEPQLLKKNQTSISQDIEEKILSMYAKGMTTSDIEIHIRDIYGVEVSDTTVSRITDKILPIAKEWQQRPLESIYTVVCNGVQREHNKKLNNGLPILHKVPPKRDYGRYFCIMAEKGGTSHGGLTEKLSPFFHAKKQEVNAYGR